ncbi:MAG: hypothetical protein ACR2G0_02285 [Chthoniobacterales bacterium]
MIAVTFALPSESSAFRRLRREPEPEIAILHTGVGAEICRRRLGPFLEQRPFDLVVSSGFSGGIDSSLGVGDLLLASNWSDPSLLARARDLLQCQVGPLATADRIIEGQAEREQFAREHHAVAVDMETRWIAEACAARNVPLLSLRAISDTIAAPFPAPPSVLFDIERQRTPTVRLLTYLLRHPSRIVRLNRFAGQVKVASRNLAAALDLVVRDMNGTRR